MARISTALAVKRAVARARQQHHPHYTPAPIIVRTRPAGVHHPKKKHHGRSGGLLGGGGGLGGIITPKRIGVGLGALVLGFLQKSQVQIPALPILGEAGTIALVAAVLSDRGKFKLADDVATAAIAVALHEFGQTGKVTGVGEVPDPSGYGGGFVSGF